MPYARSKKNTGSVEYRMPSQRLTKGLKALWPEDEALRANLVRRPVGSEN